jgi:hypothetical protein
MEASGQTGLKPYSPERSRDPRITFGEVAAHYVKFELPDDQSHATIEKIAIHDHEVQALSK